MGVSWAEHVAIEAKRLIVHSPGPKQGSAVALFFVMCLQAAGTPVWYAPMPGISPWTPIECFKIDPAAGARVARPRQNKTDQADCDTRGRHCHAWKLR